MLSRIVPCKNSKAIARAIANSLYKKTKMECHQKRWYEEKRVQDHWKAIFKANDIIHKLERGFKVQFNKNALRKDIQAQRQRDAFAKLPPNMRRHLIKNAPDRRHDQALQRATPRGVMYKPSFMMGMRPKNVLHRPYIRGEQEHHVQHVSKQLRYKNKQITSKGDLQYKFKHFSHDKEGVIERRAKPMKEKFNTKVNRVEQPKDQVQKEIIHKPFKTKARTQSSIRHMTVRDPITVFSPVFPHRRRMVVHYLLKKLFPLKRKD